jgi:hypothetical protein
MITNSVNLIMQHRKHLHEDFKVMAFSINPCQLVAGT